MSELPDVATADDPNVELCTVNGTNHDWRPHEYLWCNVPHTSWRCVWCHGVACGDYGDADPCWEPYHHSTPHRTRSGVTWPIGEVQPPDLRGAGL